MREKISEPQIEAKEDFYQSNALRERILQGVENHTEGVNIERIEEFAHSHGVKMTDYRLVTPEQIPVIQAILGEDHNFLNDESKGLLHVTTNIVFVLRDVEYERKNGAAYIEGFLMHELLHGATDYIVHTSNTEQTKQPLYLGPIHLFSRSIARQVLHVNRVGFAHVNVKSIFSGAFFEEGMAEMLRAEYMRNFMSEAVKMKIAHQFNIGTQEIFQNRVSLTIGETRLNHFPTELLYLTPEEELVTNITSSSAAGLMQLCEKIEGLKSALYAARADPKKLRAVPKLINSIDSGLYSFLMRLTYTEEDFALGAKKIESILSE